MNNPKPEPSGLHAVHAPLRCANRAEHVEPPSLAVQITRPSWLPTWVWASQKILLSIRNELLLEQTWTPGWAPGPVWTQKTVHIQK